MRDDHHKEIAMDVLSVEVLKWAASRGKAYGLTPEDLDDIFMTLARLTYFARTGNRLPASFTLDEREEPDENA